MKKAKKKKKKKHTCAHDFDGGRKWEGDGRRK
jgi:hypothetical protein